MVMNPESSSWSCMHQASHRSNEIWATQPDLRSWLSWSDWVEALHSSRMSYMMREENASKVGMGALEPTKAQGTEQNRGTLPIYSLGRESPRGPLTSHWVFVVLSSQFVLSVVVLRHTYSLTSHVDLGAEGGHDVPWGQYSDKCPSELLGCQDVGVRAEAETHLRQSTGCDTHCLPHQDPTAGTEVNSKAIVMALQIYSKFTLLLR